MSLTHPAAGQQVVVVGGGLIGVACAWLLQRRGHQVLLLDAGGDAVGDAGAPGPARASDAALGVLMARVAARDRGRGWRLRQRSLALWEAWRAELAGRRRPLLWRPGLLLLSGDAEGQERQRLLVEQRRRAGLDLEIWGRSRLEALQPELPRGALSGLHSPCDGQLDPVQARRMLLEDAGAAGLTRRRARLEGLERRGQGGGWRLRLAEGERLESGWLVLAAGLASGALLAPLGLEWPLQPVLGQALELELARAWPEPCGWPGAVVWAGINLVPRPDLEGGRRLWLGATVEPGEHAAAQALAAMRELGGAAPPWLAQAQLVRRWQGLRPRPLGRPAPLLEEPEPGLLLLAGHYRNGVLLAPASAEWALSRIVGACVDGDRALS